MADHKVSYRSTHQNRQNSSEYWVLTVLYQYSVKARASCWEAILSSKFHVVPCRDGTSRGNTAIWVSWTKNVIAGLHVAHLSKPSWFLSIMLHMVSLVCSQSLSSKTPLMTTKPNVAKKHAASAISRSEFLTSNDKVYLSSSGSFGRVHFAGNEVTMFDHSRGRAAERNIIRNPIPRISWNVNELKWSVECSLSFISIQGLLVVRRLAEPGQSNNCGLWVMLRDTHSV